jgi:MoxR-like ATPase
VDEEQVQQIVARLRAAIAEVFLGKPEVVDRSLTALLGQGHLLIEDVPGVGKTLLARAIAKSLDCKFTRIQFTPDLLPSDILGSSVYNAQTGEFRFRPGPLFANVVLADEINRTSPRTQSALLEGVDFIECWQRRRHFAIFMNDLLDWTRLIDELLASRV